MRRCNKAQLAELFQVAVSTVDGWIRRGCPVVERGDLARPWTFDALAVAEWRYSTSREPPSDIDTMSAQARRAWYESELIRVKLEARCRELYRAEEVAEVIEVVTRIVSQSVRELPDRIVTEAGLTQEIAATAGRMIEPMVDNFARKLQTLTDPDG